MRRALAWVGAAVLAGCGTRDRLTFPSETPGDGFGPVTVVLEPGVPDTTVFAGNLVFVVGRSSDSDGVDSVYIDVSGLGQAIPPILGEGRDTVNFAVQLSTNNHSGASVVVLVHAVDMLGNVGSTVTRQIHVE